MVKSKDKINPSKYIRISVHKALKIMQSVINNSKDTIANEFNLLGKENKKKKQKIIKQKKKGNIKMKTSKYLKLFIVPVILLTVTVTAFSLKNNEKNSGLKSVSFENRFEGSSEFFYKADDERTWHVINRYTSGLSEDLPACNNSQYEFTTDTVTVINDYVGICKEEFISNNQIAQIK